MATDNIFRLLSLMGSGGKQPKTFTRVRVFTTGAGTDVMSFGNHKMPNPISAAVEIISSGATLSSSFFDCAISGSTVTVVSRCAPVSINVRIVIRNF